MSSASSKASKGGGTGGPPPEEADADPQRPKAEHPSKAARTRGRGHQRAPPEEANADPPTTEGRAPPESRKDKRRGAPAGPRRKERTQTPQVNCSDDELCSVVNVLWVLRAKIPNWMQTMAVAEQSRERHRTPDVQIIEAFGTWETPLSNCCWSNLNAQPPVSQSVCPGPIQKSIHVVTYGTLPPDRSEETLKKPKQDQRKTRNGAPPESRRDARTGAPAGPPRKKQTQTPQKPKAEHSPKAAMLCGIGSHARQARTT